MGKSLGTMDIYKPSYGDCSNGGISHNFSTVLVWDSFDIDAPENAVVIIKDVIMGSERIRAKPARHEKKWDMFGGCLIYTSNGCVPNSGIAIKLYDRFE